jgi:hypothetical protein
VVLVAERPAAAPADPEAPLLAKGEVPVRAGAKAGESADAAGPWPLGAIEAHPAVKTATAMSTVAASGQHLVALDRSGTFAMIPLVS